MNSTNNDLKVREKYSGLSYDELVQIAQETNMTNRNFIMAQPELTNDFMTWLEDRGLTEYDEEEATAFLEEQELLLTYQEE